MSMEQRNSIYVFFAYARKDRPLRDKLEDHLSNLKYRGLITTWHDTEIRAGEEWLQQVEIYLNTARIILLLISVDFMASEYCYSLEMKRAMARHQRGEAHVIPIILRPVLFKDEPFTQLRMLPTNGKPVVSWRNRDSAFVDVALGIERVVQELVASTNYNNTAATPPPALEHGQQPPPYQKQIDYVQTGGNTPPPPGSSIRSMVICPHCGAEARQGDNFCLNCGNRLLPTTPSPQQAPPVMGGNPTNPSQERPTPPIRNEVPAAISPSTMQVPIKHLVHFVLQTENGDILAEYPLEKPRISIGRASDNDILLWDKLISRHHATLRYENGSYVLYDESSVNGTFVNSQKLEGTTPRVLQDGDHISIGKYKLVFHDPPASHEVEDMPSPTLAASRSEISTYRIREDEDLAEAERVREYYEKALAAYEQALHLDFWDANAYKGKGKTLYELGRFDEALQALEQAISLDPKPVTYVSKGDILSKLGRYNDALIAYQQALQLDPTFGLAYNNMANTLEQIGRRQEAQQARDKAKQLGYDV